MNPVDGIQICNRKLLSATIKRIRTLCGSKLNTSHFARLFNTFIIGALGIRIGPPKGWSSSRIKKMAQATVKAEATKASVVVALGGATRLKPKKMTTSHETRMISIGFEIDGIDSATSSDRS